jgi:GNAT superfamily N-acetyltransferase
LSVELRRKMKITYRTYQPYQDSSRVSEFLARTYPPADRSPNWLRARWEYMVYAVQDGVEENLASFGVWESRAKIVGLANFEDGPGEVYLQVHPDHTHLQAEMLSYAERTLSKSEDGRKGLTIWVNAFDGELQSLVQERGYVRAEWDPQVVSRLDPASSLDYALLDGFEITDRQECGDLRAINRVLWRGFNHEGPAPEQYVAGRADVEKAPMYRGELTVMVRAPDGHLVSYCGMWYEEATGVAYVEPVATDPDYRRRGLGKAAVLEATRRARDLGAKRTIVNSGLAFYRAIGFRQLFTIDPWHKMW